MVTIDVWRTTALESLHPMLLQWMYNVSLVCWLINRNQTVALLPTYTESTVSLTINVGLKESRDYYA